MREQIEDTFRPETTNELALMHRIRNLKAEFYRAGKVPNYYDDMAGPPRMVSLDETSIRIPLAVGAEVVEEPLRYIVRAQASGGYADGKGATFGHRVFIDKGTFGSLDKYGVMRYLDEVRRATDHTFAEFLMKQKETP